MVTSLLYSLSIITALLLLASFAITMHSLVTFIAGLLAFRRLRKCNAPGRCPDSITPPPVLPFISLIVTAKNEKNVICKSLESMVQIDYPKDRYEIVVVEDGSSDGTLEACMECANKHPGIIKVFHKDMSSGKPSALNYALARCRGEIVGVFDADSMPSPDSLRAVASRFSSGAVALQGMTKSEANGGFLARLISHEHDAWFNAYLMGKKRLGLFVPLSGSCQFIRRDIIDKMGGWDERSLTEDMDLSIRLVDARVPVDYETSVRDKEGCPASVGALYSQRLRWFRGWIELILPSIPKTFRGRAVADAMVTLLGPLVFAMFPVLLAIGFALSLFSLQVPTHWLQVTLYPFIVVSFLSLVTLAGAAIAFLDRVSWYRAILWIPIIYLYWGLLNVVALVALLQALVRWPKKWLRTAKVQP